MHKRSITNKHVYMVYIKYGDCFLKYNADIKKNIQLNIFNSRLLNILHMCVRIKLFLNRPLYDVKGAFKLAKPPFKPNFKIIDVVA